jgi:hypothetical protein
MRKCPPCTRCGGIRFSLKRDNRRKRKLSRYCLDCHKKRAEAWRNANPDLHRAVALASYHRHKFDDTPSTRKDQP